jgi:hypothetical protein
VRRTATPLRSPSRKTRTPTLRAGTRCRRAFLTRRSDREHYQGIEAQWVRLAVKAQHPEHGWLKPGQLVWAAWADDERNNLVVALGSGDENRVILSPASAKQYLLTTPLSDDKARPVKPSKARAEGLGDTMAKATAVLIAHAAAKAAAAAQEAQS